MSSGILAPLPQIQRWPPRWPPQTILQLETPLNDIAEKLSDVYCTQVSRGLIYRPITADLLVRRVVKKQNRIGRLWSG